MLLFRGPIFSAPARKPGASPGEKKDPKADHMQALRKLQQLELETVGGGGSVQELILSQYLT